MEGLEPHQRLTFTMGLMTMKKASRRVAAAVPQDQPSSSAAGRRGQLTGGVAVPALPLSAEGIAQDQEITRRFQGNAVLLRQHNLNIAVLLAQQAARHGGELADHFGKIGRWFGHLLDATPQPSLRLVKGGRT